MYQVLIGIGGYLNRSVARAKVSRLIITASSITPSTFPSIPRSRCMYATSSSIISSSLTPGANPTLTVTNPYDNTAITSLSETTPSEIRSALKAAKRAQEEWKRTDVSTRNKLLDRLADSLQENREDFARTLTQENGMTKQDAHKEVDRSLNIIRWCQQPALHTHGTSVTSTHTRMDSVTYSPIGVVLAITPWNVPLSMLVRKFAPAIAAGCTVLVKPSEKTPLTTLAFANLVSQVGFPDGVMQAVISSHGAHMLQVVLQSGLIGLVSFTGSSRVGHDIAAKCIANGVHVALELGGNAPFIVAADADLEQAVCALVVNKTRVSGQTCISANRIFAHADIHDELVDRLEKRVRDLRIGNGLKDGVDMGPLIDESAARRVEGMVKGAVDKGARLRCGGHADGSCMMATVLTGVTDEMEIARKEIFGPVWSVLKFDDEEEVVRRANDGVSGLACYVFTENGARGMRLADRLEFGMIGLNHVGISEAGTPFGGMKHSGVGREGGLQALRAYMECKYVSVAKS